MSIQEKDKSVVGTTEFDLLCASKTFDRLQYTYEQKAIFAHLIFPSLRRYLNPDNPFFEIMNFHTYLERIWRVQTVEIRRMRPLKEFKMRGLYMREDFYPTQGINMVTVQPVDTVFVRTDDADKQRIDVEVVTPTKYHWYRLDQDDWRYISRFLEEEPSGLEEMQKTYGSEILGTLETAWPETEIPGL